MSEKPSNLEKVQNLEVNKESAEQLIWTILILEAAKPNKEREEKISILKRELGELGMLEELKRRSKELKDSLRKSPDKLEFDDKKASRNLAILAAVIVSLLGYVVYDSWVGYSKLNQNSDNPEDMQSR